jgi:hypothetical protein
VVVVVVVVVWPSGWKREARGGGLGRAVGNSGGGRWGEVVGWCERGGGVV